MKRFISLMCAVIFVLSVPVAAFAMEYEQKTIYYADGSYMTVEITENHARSSESLTASKKYTYYNDNDVSQWKAVLTGSFSYTGSSATCTSSSVDMTIYNSEWYVSYKTAGKSGNKATASVTMKKTSDKITSTVPVNLTLTCDANGNLS